MIAYLVIRTDQTIRVAKRPRIAADEVAIKLNLIFPPGWGRVIGQLDIAVPDFTPEVKLELDP